MLRKSIAIIIATIILAAMFVVPASAESIADTMFFNVDFGAGTADDKTGNYTYQPDMSGAEILCEDDATLGKKVEVFNDDNCGNMIFKSNNGFTFQDYDLAAHGITMEIYLYIDPEVTEFQQNQTFFEANFGSIHLQEYNDGKDTSMGFRCCSGTNAAGNFDMCNAYEANTLPRKQWLHLVGTSDGKKNYYYMNGALVATSNDRPTTTADTRYGQYDDTILIGESVYGSMFGETSMRGKVAFARMYKTYVTDAEVAAMYADAQSGKQPEGPTADPSQPSPAPQDNPTPAPADNPTSAPASKPTPAPTNPNAKTFDIGLISLAAVSLSSLVVVKRKKK